MRGHATWRAMVKENDWSVGGGVAVRLCRVPAKRPEARACRGNSDRTLRQRTKAHRIRRQQACNADDPNEASGLELKKEEMTRLQERLAEIPSRLEQLKRARQRHISRTDPDSRFLRDRRGFTLGYTVDVAVSEDHLIVEQRVTQAATDNASLLPVVEAVERRCGEMPQKVSADSGFFSVKNLEALTASGIDAMCRTPTWPTL